MRNWAELLVADELRRRGMRVEGVNLRLPPHEVDVVARQGEILWLVEVRLRTIKHLEEALTGEEIPWAKRQQLLAWRALGSRIKSEKGITGWRQLGVLLGLVFRLSLKPEKVLYLLELVDVT